MNTAIALETKKTPAQANDVAAIIAAIKGYHASARDMNLQNALPANSNQHKVEWVTIRLTNPQNLI